MEHHCEIDDKKISTDITEHGLSVMLIAEDDEGPKFGYSVGLFHNYQHPEIILFGLDSDLIHWMLNEIAARIRNGEQFEADKEYDGLLEGYNCTFRSVPRDAYRDYFGYALHFYKNDRFPALQLIWPDKAGKWPWELEFNHKWIWQQPLLECWPELNDWPFDEPRNLGVYTTIYVLDGSRPILQVCHDDDGDWQFLCGTTNTSEHGRLVCLREIISMDRSVRELASLPTGWRAWRADADAKWQREEMG